MSEHVHVEPDVLHAASRATGRIGAALQDAIRANAPRLTGGGVPGVWAAGRALNQCSGAWEQELTRTAEALHETGDKLATAAGRYAEVERRASAVLTEFLREVK